MKTDLFSKFAPIIERLGPHGFDSPELIIESAGGYSLRYIPFEYVNPHARLVLVGITPGNTQLKIAYERAQALLIDRVPESDILAEVKKLGAFGGPAVRPNLLRMLRHFRFDHILGIDDLETLWDVHSDLLYATSVVPQAAFHRGDMFKGSFNQVMDTPILKDCFIDQFLPALESLNKDALFVGLGDCPRDALTWCVKEDILAPEQVLGAFCHPSTSGGSTVKYYLRQVKREDMHPDDPVRRRTETLDRDYARMHAATAHLLGSEPPPPLEVLLATNPKKASVAPTAKPKTRSARTASQPTPVIEEKLRRIIDAAESAGFIFTHATKKVAKFVSPSSEVVYVLKERSQINDIRIIAHPEHRFDSLRRIKSAAAVDGVHKYHANLTDFPKRINKGKRPTAYGWQVHIASLGELPKFLSELDKLSTLHTKIQR